MASKHLQQADGRGGMSAGAVVAPGLGGPAWAGQVALPRAAVSLSEAPVTLGVGPKVAAPARAGRARVGWGALAALGGGALLGLAGARGVARLEPAATPTSAAAMAQRPFVSVALRASAPGVRFRFEDGRTVANPYVGLVPRDDRPQVVWAEAPGFLPRKLQLTFNDDVTADDVLLVAGGAESARSAALPPPPPPPPRPKLEHNALLRPPPAKR